MKRLVTLVTILILFIVSSSSQQKYVKFLEIIGNPGPSIKSYTLNDSLQIIFPQLYPLFSFEVNDSLRESSNASFSVSADSSTFSFSFGIIGSIKKDFDFQRGCKLVITFYNRTNEVKKISNVVPLGIGSDRTYITAEGPTTGIHRLSRTRLYRPGLMSLGVIVPDNAWELGYCDVQTTTDRSLTGLSRRTKAEKADWRRYSTILKPNGSVEYVFYFDEHRGDWHEGLNMMFRERWLYDLEKFDNTLFERKDLEWARRSYVFLFQFAWDQTWYDAIEGKYNFEKTFSKWNNILGGFEAFMIWPTWPRLGMDQRNQFDLYRDLPGGLPALRKQAEFTHKFGAKYFISYNPWDESTRKEDHITGMASLLKDIDADGVVLDTWGESSKEFQNAADAVKRGIILYSEGMAVPKDMPGIVAGRVHDALYMPPPLNLNKLIKPEFAIFRVLQVVEGKLHREVAVSFFNGYGTEINIMRAGRPDWIDEEFHYLGRTTKILRENSPAFLAKDWTPLINTLADSIWVNQWQIPSKTIYTVYSLIPEGYDAHLFEVQISSGWHYVSLWHHNELKPVNINGKNFIPVKTDAFNRSALGTREEANIDCIARLPKLLDCSLENDMLTFNANRGDKIVVWAGMPSYDCRKDEFPVSNQTIQLHEYIGMHQEKIVVQLFDGKDLLDENVLFIPLATPRLVTKIERTKPAKAVPEGMVEIQGGSYSFVLGETKEENLTVPYPNYSKPRIVFIQKFFMDKFPVTNAQYKKFLDATGYKPKDKTNFLKHWIEGRPAKGTENYPVVCVSLEDARAFAKWDGKRLPTDIEWQYAAQGTDGRKWPWGNEFDSTRCNNRTNRITPVDAFPQGASPFGVLDLVGNVWQLTDDVYNNGCYYYGILRGGSYYNPTSSIWYVTGGPWPVNLHKMLLMVSPSFDRNLTIGFRCVKDSE